jgi:hypothetical protein
VLRFCETCNRYRLDGDTQLLRVVTSGPDEGRRVYACHQCVRDEGLVPSVAAFTGHRDTAPSIATQETP